VVDPFLGSGTTALAAINLGRQFVGIERNKKNVRLAEIRIANLSKEEM
jgi:DNA modification methylase